MRCLAKKNGEGLSVRTAMILTMLVMILLFTALSTGAFYMIGSIQIQQSVSANTLSLISNIGNALDHSIENLMKQFYSMIDSQGFYRFKYSLLGDAKTVDPRRYIEMSQLLDVFVNQNAEMIDTAFLVSDDRSILRFLGNNALKAIHFDFDSLYARYGSDLPVWLEDDAPLLFDTIYPQDTTLRLMLLLGTPERARHGVLSFNIRVEYLTDMLNTQAVTRGSHLYLMYGNQSIRKEETFTLTEDQLERLNRSGAVTVERIGANRIYFRPTAIPKLALAVVMPESELYLQLADSSLVWPVMLFIIGIFSLGIFLMMSRLMTKPIDRISQKMTLVRQGKLDTKFDIHGLREVNQMNENAQNLTDSISDLLKRVYDEQKSKRRAEMAVLQSQINPHFLYNTLYAAQQLCDADEPREAGRMIRDLATFYRIGVSKGRNRIPLREELKHVRSYLDIQKMCNAEAIDYDLDVDDLFLDAEIVKLTLQPLVENAIYHGLLPRRAPGRIMITAEYTGQLLCVSVADDGVGIPPEQLAALRTTMDDFEPEDRPNAYGLRNVHQRLRLAYGEACGLTVDSTPGDGTTVNVWLPFALPEEVET